LFQLRLMILVAKTAKRRTKTGGSNSNSGFSTANPFVRRH
jgi:hypothetical protein